MIRRATSPTAEVPRPAIVQADFRTEAEVATIHNGAPLWICVCHELVAGRWESFVSMRPRR